MLTSHGLDHPATGPHRLLADHHGEIQGACAALRACTYSDDPGELVARFRSLERAVLEHLSAEEESLLPSYADYDPPDAETIRATHDELRRQLFRIGVDVELHCVRAETLEVLVTTLREHAAHEDRFMYPWAQAHLPLPTRRQLFKRIAHSLRTLTSDRSSFEASKQSQG